MPGDRVMITGKGPGASCLSRLAGRSGAAVGKKDKLQPRSSSPVTVYVELPCVIEQAFSTIAWDDLEDSAARREMDSLGSQVNGSEADDQDFGDYALDFMADSPSTLESSLSPAELVPFQGCVIPPLTPPHPQFCPEDSHFPHPPLHPHPPHHHTVSSSNPPDGAEWRGIAQSQGRALVQSVEDNNQLHETLQRRQEELDSLQNKNLHLRQLAGRAKHLASVLEKLMSARDQAEPAGPSRSPCKRQRLDEGYETEDSVEDMLRDVSTRCDAALRRHAPPKTRQETGVRMVGTFSSFKTSNASKQPRTEDTSFRTSIGTHGTIRTQVFPHGRAFTSRTQEGGYRFRWVPNNP